MSSNRIVRHAAGALLALAVLGAGRPAAAQPAPGGSRFPAEVTTTVAYDLDSQEDVGTPNVPMCRTRDWRAEMRLRFRLKRVAAGEAEYESVGGDWTASGSCSGEMTWTQADEVCTWTTRGRSSGAGAFAPGGGSSASLFLRPDGTYQVTFLLDGVRSSRTWNSPCRRDGSGDATAFLTGSVQDVRYTLQGGELTLAPQGERRTTNENVDGIYHHRWAVNAGIQQPVQVAIDGPSCGCMDAEDAEGPTLRFSARATVPGGTFTRFVVQATGEAPREISSTEGSTPTLQLAGTARTGHVTLRITYRRSGEEFTAEHEVDFCAIDTLALPGSTDLTFDDSPEGRLVLDATSRAWFNGEVATAALRWTLPRMGEGTTLAPEEVTGGAAQFVYTGLPEFNGAFGPKELRAELRRGGCECARTREIRTFFRALARNHPHADDPEGSPYHDMPNWLYYWSQTAAMGGVPVGKVRHVAGMNDGQGNTVAGRYDEDEDRVLLSEAAFIRPCVARLDRATRAPTGDTSRGIDCFGETMRHEWQHRTEWFQWWPSGEASLIGDLDADGVPTEVEERTEGCDPYSQRSCADRPFPGLVTDREYQAYWVGWQWPIGSADREDWSCNGKQWQGGACSR